VASQFFARSGGPLQHQRVADAALLPGDRRRRPRDGLPGVCLLQRLTQTALRNRWLWSAGGLIKECFEQDGLAPRGCRRRDGAADQLQSPGLRAGGCELPALQRRQIATYYVDLPRPSFRNLARYDGVKYGYSAPTGAPWLR